MALSCSLIGLSQFNKTISAERSFTDNMTRNELGNSMWPVIINFVKQGDPVAQAVCSGHFSSFPYLIS